MAANKKTYAVWVGNLTDKITEPILFQEFKSYGPICSAKLRQSKDGRMMGFVNFYNKDVAEVAANDMDGAVINGITITTSFKDESSKGKDLRPLTDCEYFMQHRKCTKNCIFRHEEAARSSSTVCAKWKKHQCTDVSCKERHPGSKAFNQKDKLEATNISPRSDQVDKQGPINTGNQIDKQKSPEKPCNNADQKFVGIYWDIENCQLPSHIDPHSFVEKIRSKFLHSKKLAEFLCACDNTRLRKSVIDGLSNAGVDVIHVSATAKNAADDRLKLRIQDFGYKYEEQAFVILISGDVNFAPVLNTLRYSLNVYTVLIHNKQASSHLKALADEKYIFDDFVADIAITASPTNTDCMIRTTELLVHNLPFEMHMEDKVKERLCILSGNYGGRIRLLLRDDSTREAKCIMYFSSAHDADRASARMQGQDVFGCKINIEKYWGRGPLKADKESTSSGFNSMMPTNQANRIPRGNMHNAYSMDGLHSRNLARGQFFQDDAANGLPPINMPAAGYRNQPNQNRLQHTRMKKAASAKSMGDFMSYGSTPKVNPMVTNDIYGRANKLIDDWNKEKAGKGAKDRNDKSINGILKTASLVDERHKRKDIRPLMDCIYFIQRKPCKKGCIYRHEEAVLANNTVCAKWLKRQCDDKFCKERHPNLKGMGPQESNGSKEREENDLLSFDTMMADIPNNLPNPTIRPEVVNPPETFNDKRTEVGDLISLADDCIENSNKIGQEQVEKARMDNQKTDVLLELRDLMRY